MKIALIGNQNSGKSTLFNLLTGSHQKIGNWPGVTVERKVGQLRTTTDELIDLPGIYSLSPYTLEEEITRNYLLNEQVDLILNIIDTTQLERSLYLTTQLLELDIPVLIALNMEDVAIKSGLQIDYQYLEEKLDTTMIRISALKKTGIFELIQTIKQKNYRQNQYKPFFDHFLEKNLGETEKELTGKHRRFYSVKLYEEDPAYESYLSDQIKAQVEMVKNEYQLDLVQVIADERYRFIEMMRDDAIQSKKDKMTMTDKIDRVILNRFFAIPIFMVIMFTVYYLAAGPVGQFLTEFVEGGVESFSEWFDQILLNAGASSWSRSLVIQGIVTGVGAILAFLPQLIILLILIALLETTGYMNRISFFLDRVFQKAGLSGKSLIPFIIGSGCTVPAIVSTRTIKDESERQMTILLTPFVPCSAKLPIITLFAGYFFPSQAGWISASLYFLAIVVIIFSAFMIKKLFYQSKSSSFILELPPYKLPHFGYLTKDVGRKVWAFIQQAGSIILLASVVVWLFISFSFRLEYGVPIDQSILAGIGKLFSWIFYPFLGTMSWEATVSALQGLVAKEQVVASMAIIGGYSGEVSSGNFIFSSQAFQFFTPASAYAFMVFNLFSAPCFGAIGAMRKELGNAKKMWTAVFFQTGIAWVFATIMFQIIRLIGVII